MRQADFAKQSHRQALSDLIEAMQHDGSSVPLPRTDSGAITDPFEAIRFVEAMYSDDGLRLVLFNGSLAADPVFSEFLSPHAARVVALQLLVTADWAERAIN
jgi:hypothetical protein